MPKRIPKKKSTRSSTPQAYLWLVPFTFHRPRTKQDGTFQMVVEAPIADEAMERCRERLIDLTEDDFVVQGTGYALFGWAHPTEWSLRGGGHSQFRAATSKRRLSNLMPQQPKHDAMMFRPAREPGTVEPFLTFGIDDGDDESASPLNHV